MLTVAYITNEFPTEVEWYVIEEIRELRGRGVRVIPCSAHRKDNGPNLSGLDDRTLYLLPPEVKTLLRGLWMLCTERRLIRDLLRRMLLGGDETVAERARAAAHTILGGCYAVLLRIARYSTFTFITATLHPGSRWLRRGCWEFLFSMTLHGSDLLLHGKFMDTKLNACSFCLTVSPFNRAHILKTYPKLNPDKIRVQRLGVLVPNVRADRAAVRPSSSRSLLLAVGRLHPVKDYPFLLRACHALRESGETSMLHRGEETQKS